MGFELMRSGIKVAAKETILTPRFYTTDFDQMAALVDPKNLTQVCGGGGEDEGVTPLWQKGNSTACSSGCLDLKRVCT